MKIKIEVPFFRYPRLFLDEREELFRIFGDVGERGAFIMQKDVSRFETALAQFTGAKYAIGVANATDGLELAWQSVEIGSGDEVIFCSHTMLATASAIVTAGGKPIPVEIGDDNLIDADAVAAAITRRTVGIMPTHLNGRTCDMDALMGIANKHGLFVVEDAAQALGSKYKGRHAGTFGSCSAISFFPAKLLGCLGDGGAVLTNDSSTFHKVYQLHDHGRDTDGEVRCWGRNSRLDNLQAAILNHRLTTYESAISRRREIARLYHDQLKGLAMVSLPPHPDENSDRFDVYQNFELQADRRDELKVSLAKNGIGCLVQWGGKAVHQWERLGLNYRLPRVEKFFTRCLMLPMNVTLTEDEVSYICDSIKEFYGQ